MMIRTGAGIGRITAAHPRLTMLGAVTAVAVATGGAIGTTTSDHAHAAQQVRVSTTDTHWGTAYVWAQPGDQGVTVPSAQPPAWVGVSEIRARFGSRR